MSAYIIANIIIKNEASMQKYIDELEDIVKKDGQFYFRMGALNKSSSRISD